MATKKPTAKAAAKQPEAKKPAAKPEAPVTAPEATTSEPAAKPEVPATAPEVQVPEATANESAAPSKERGPAKDGNLPNDDDQNAPEGVVLEVVTRLARRIRAGVVVTQTPRTVTVSKEAAALIEADPRIESTRK